MKTELLAAAFLLPLLSAQLSAQTTLKDTLTLDESVVSALKFDRKIEETPASIAIAGIAQVREHSSLTVADALKFHPALSIGGDGVWATNINVRGLAENRLVTLIDGCRIETATDLTASLAMIDVNDISKVEVIKGAQSSLYGSGAMGGIVNVVTRQGHFAPEDYVHGTVSANASSVNGALGAYATVSAGGKRWFVRAGGGLGRAGDLMTPDGRLPNSGYKSHDLNLQAGVKITPDQTLRLRFGRNAANDVGIPGGASFSPAATATYKNISRTLGNLTYEATDITGCFTSLKFSAFVQNIIRDVEMLPNASVPASGSGPVPTRVTPLGKHLTFGGNLQGSWNFDRCNTLIAGVEGWRRSIFSQRFKYIDKYAAGVVADHITKTEKPLPDASFTSVGLFAQDESRLLDNRLILTAGARIDDNIAVNEATEIFPAGRRSYLSASGNLGAIYRITGNLDAVLNAARSYRSPQLEELFKFIDLTGNKVRLGNPDLKPEKGLSADLGIRARGKNFSVEASAYINRIDDMIVERLANGGNPARVNDTLVLDNVSKALLYGAEFNASYSPLKWLELYALGALTVAREITTGEYLPLIPPANGRIGLVFRDENIVRADLSVTLAGARPEDRIAAGENPTEGWCRLDLALSTKAFRLGAVTLRGFGGIENITDTRYTNFLSTNRSSIRCEAGRNFYLRAVLDF